MKAKKLDIIVIGACAASLAALAVVFPRLPQTIPVHWNFKGEVDGWGSRWTILIMGALPLALYLLLKIVPRLDPRKEAYEKHGKSYSILAMALSLVFIIMGLCMLASTLVPHSLVAAIVVLSSIIGGVIYLFVYSYLLWRKSSDSGKSLETQSGK